MKLIYLSQGKVTQVNDEDYEYLIQWKWCAHKGRKTYYAERIKRINGKRTYIKMHIEIAKRMGIYIKGIKVDHKDTDGLNNLRSNIRMADDSQQVCNQNLRSDNTSGHKGVCRNKREQKWVATVYQYGVLRWSGYYDDFNEACRAREYVAKLYHGEFYNPG